MARRWRDFAGAMIALLLLESHHLVQLSLSMNTRLRKTKKANYLFDLPSQNFSRRRMEAAVHSSRPVWAAGNIRFAFNNNRECDQWLRSCSIRVTPQPGRRVHSNTKRIGSNSRRSSKLHELLLCSCWRQLPPCPLFRTPENRGFVPVVSSTLLGLSSSRIVALSPPPFSIHCSKRSSSKRICRSPISRSAVSLGGLVRKHAVYLCLVSEPLVSHLVGACV